MASERLHPTYPNPTVVEAICHLEFEPSPQSGWQITRPAELLKAVSQEYPNVELGPQIGMTLGVGMGGVTPRIVQGLPQLKVTNDARTRYLALGDRHFTFGHLVPYPGWEKFREHLIYGWKKVIQLANPQVIRRVSLRYVNVIPRNPAHPRLSDWLKATDTIPKTLINSQGEPFLLRLESWVEAQSLLVLTLGLSQPRGPLSPILFDIDRISQVSLPSDPDQLLKHIDHMHDDVWLQFSSAHTSQLEAHLQGAST